jgi:cell division protein ZapA
MACGDGEEAHLERLAALLDGRIGEMRTTFGEIGDMRLQVMAALTLADELVDLRRRIAARDEEIAALRRLAESGDERSRLVEDRVADQLVRAAERIELLARSLSPTAPASAS